MLTMRRTVSALLIGFVVVSTLWLTARGPGPLSEILAHPLQSILGTERRLNSTLLEVSETAEPVRAASRRLLQPFGIVRLDRFYEAPESSATSKR